jgi:hypothetical protein
LNRMLAPRPTRGDCTRPLPAETRVKPTTRFLETRLTSTRYAAHLTNFAVYFRTYCAHRVHVRIFCFSVLNNIFLFRTHPVRLAIIIFSSDGLSPEDHTPRELCHVVSQILCAFYPVRSTSHEVCRTLANVRCTFRVMYEYFPFLSRAPSAGLCIFFPSDGCRRRTTLTPRELCHVVSQILCAFDEERFTSHEIRPTLACERTVHISRHVRIFWFSFVAPRPPA